MFLKEPFCRDGSLLQVSNRIGRYSETTGEPIEVTNEILKFIDEKTIPYSKEQVEELSKSFYHVSLIVKSPAGKRYTCKSLEQFMGDYNQICAELQPKEA